MLIWLFVLYLSRSHAFWTNINTIFLQEFSVMSKKTSLILDSCPLTSNILKKRGKNFCQFVQRNGNCHFQFHFSSFTFSYIRETFILMKCFGWLLPYEIFIYLFLTSLHLMESMIFGMACVYGLWYLPKVWVRFLWQFWTNISNFEVVYQNCHSTYTCFVPNQ